ncbi:MAG: Xaa-Pro peptidase family protein [Pseudomonadota bacterium]|nr:Xaa-Pro peptidase family protein [Pseudomonadota bacterium]
MTPPDQQTAASLQKFNEFYALVPAAEISSRITALQKSLIEPGFGGCLLLQNTDIFYFAGTMQSGVLFIPARGEPVFWIRRSLERARTESPLNDIRPLETIDKTCREIKDRLPAGTSLGLELDVLPTRIFQRYVNELAQIQLSDISPLIRSLRALKSDYELECIKKACRIASEVFAVAKTLIRPGTTEIELQAELEYQARIRGHLGIARMHGWNNELFFGHVISGAAAATRGYMDAPTNGIGLSPAFPQGATINPLEPGIPVSIDFMINHNGYLSDATRMFCLGKPDKKLARAHQELLELNRRLLAAIKPGVKAESIFETAMDLADKMGYGDNFLGSGCDRVSFVGHGVGLEVDEFPFLARGSQQILEPGMVFALEPKFIFPGLGVATIENTYLLTADGVKQLTGDEENIIKV